MTQRLGRLALIGLIATGILVGLVGRPAAAATSNEAAAAKALLAKVNAGRRGFEIGSLKSWTIPVAEAAKHSSYQASRGKISHDGFSSRWNKVKASGSGIASMCENVATTKGQTRPEDAAAVMYKLWTKSRPHFDCMFDRTQRAIWTGIAVKQVGDTWYATLLAVADSSTSKP